VCCCKHEAVLKVLTRHAVTADAGEVAANSRSACAKLRVAQKI
jgi:16S rRNA C1402 N4-methylase RsmH